LQGIEAQVAAVKAARARLRIDPTTATGRAVQALQGVRAIGAGGAWVLATEIFGWREIRNGRELGALVGLAPALYQSGATQRDRGITRAGNAHVRRMRPRDCLKMSSCDHFGFVPSRRDFAVDRATRASGFFQNPTSPQLAVSRPSRRTRNGFTTGCC
jgi:transposase